MTKQMLSFLSVTLMSASLSFMNNVLANTDPVQDVQISGQTIIPVGGQSPQLRRSLSLPEHGQTMDDVRKQLGSPHQTNSIGEPPITRWHYPEKKITIYFESNRVIRSVLHNTDETGQ